MSYWNLKATVNTSNLWNIPRILFDKHITCSSQADMRLSPTKVFQKLQTSGSFVKRMNPVAVKAVKLVTNKQGLAILITCRNNKITKLWFWEQNIA